MPEDVTTQDETPEQNGQPTPPSSETPPWGDSFDPARAWQTIQTQRKAEQELRKQLDEIQRTLKAREDADLSESERLKKRLSELEAAKGAWATEREQIARDHQQRIVQYEVMLAASRAVTDKDGKITRAAFRDPADAFQFLPHDAIEFDDHNQPTNVAALLAKLAKDKPYLLVEEATAPPRPNGVPASPPAANGRDLTEQQQREARERNARTYRSRF